MKLWHYAVIAIIFYFVGAMYPSLATSVTSKVTSSV